MATIYVSDETKSGLSPRMTADSYLTDPVLAHAVLNWMLDSVPGVSSITQVLDPGAGSGVWGEAVRWAFKKKKRFAVDGVELRTGRNPGYYDHWFPRTDFLHWPCPVFYDLIIGNPPFKLAEAFVERSLSLLMPGGVLCFLLPVDFAHGQGRSRGLFSEHQPDRVVSLAERPVFRGPQGQSLGNANPNNFILMLWHQHNTLNETSTWESFSWKKTKK